MADLKKFMWSGAQSGMPMDLYLNRWPQIGNAKAEKVESLHVIINGKGTVLGRTFQIAIEVIMPDTNPSGTCTVILNGARQDGCAYNTNGGSLIINHPSTQITLQANDKKWTWVHVNNPISVWIGAWPTGMAMAHEDNFGEVR